MNRIFHLAAILLVTLAWSSLVSCSRNLNGEIHDAARNGDLTNLKALLAANPDLVSTKDTNGMTPLHYAAHNGDTGMVEFLLANKAEVNATDKYGQTPLDSAARLGHKDVVELLLTNNADVNARNDFGWTPLHEAAIGGHTDVAELLLANGANVNARDKYGDTPLHDAAMFDRMHMAQARSDKAEVLASTNLDLADGEGYKDVVKLLLANGANINAGDTNGTTPLHEAVSSGHKDIVELLLAHGADVNARDNQGITPLHEAATGAYKDVAELLLANKADVNARDNKGETALHMVLAQATDSRYEPETELGKRNVEMAELLLANGANVNAKDNNGSTPLDYPAANFKDFANLLRQHGGTNEFIGEKFILTAKDVDPKSVRLIATNTPTPNLLFKFAGKTSDEIQDIGQNHRWVQIMKDDTNVTETAWVSIYLHQKTNYGLVLIFDDYEKAKLAEKTLRGE